MSTMKYAFAMLAPGAMVMLASAAQGATIDGVLSNPEGTGPAYVETFNVDITGYVDQGSSNLFDFRLFNDSHGNNTLSFGDYTTTGLFGTGYNSGVGVSFSKIDFTFPGAPGYDDAPFTLQPGTYTGFFGTTLTLSAPEPDAWALLIAGAAMTGAALRVSRRRRQVASSAMA